MLLFRFFYKIKYNQNHVRPYPDANFYSPEFMTAKISDVFLNWYADKKKESVFLFKQEMMDYCRSDVDIFCRASMRYCDLLIEATPTKGVHTALIHFTTLLLHPLLWQFSEQSSCLKHGL